ncbi:MAG: hypothetical protein HUJ25_01005 [Crocinitomicaceae bacterium]|nr:hypothetical protein [Crocinitomicaceae bacterium]
MRYLFLITPVLLLFLSCTTDSDCDEQLAGADSSAVEEIAADTLLYDSLYAAELGADDYGMKTYVMAFLKKGPNRDLDSASAAELQRAHMDNINRLAEDGKLVLAGPFYGDGEIRGIYLFDVATIEEAEELTKTDPAIQEGSLVMELVRWYGSAALMEVNNIHEKIQKESF